MGKGICWGLCLVFGFGVLTLGVEAQEPKPTPSEQPATPGHDEKAPAPATTEMQKVLEHLRKTLPSIESIKPVPPPMIPDPPPHEGAMHDYPLTIQPPDVVLVEVLEALPGRPITGERLVRPDGTITLGFYGDIHVRGLSISQAKTKIILHLRSYLSDESLGLIGTQFPEEHAVPAPEEKKDDGPKGAGLPPTPKRVRRATFVQTPGGQEGNPVEAQAAEKIREALEKEAPVNVDDQPMNFPIPPEDSDRVMVDISSYNAHVYYVLGEVAEPGRIPCTGNDTILDAIQFSGGLTPDAAEETVKLVRPGVGDQPARAYEVDLKAIRDEGNAKANLQLFPGDRLIIYRKDVIKAEPEPKLPQAMRSEPRGNFVLMGLFSHPGWYPCGANVTVLDAIQMGGGLSAQADLASLRIVRDARDGQERSTAMVDLKAIMEKGDAKTNYVVSPGDQLIIGPHTRAPGDE